MLPRTKTASFVLAALVALAQSGCYVLFPNSSACSSGQTQVCRSSDNACVCGSSCFTNSDCYSTEICAATMGSSANGCVSRSFWTGTDDGGTAMDTGTGTDAATPRDGSPPVQLDGGVVVVSDAGGVVRSDAGGMISRDATAAMCSPACGASQVCIQYADSTTMCAQTCTTNSECSTGCCSALTNGQHVCLDASFCGAASCGGFSCYSDEECVNWTGYGDSCSGYCRSSADCPSGCCVGLSNGTSACAPSSAYCGSSTCGGYTCYAGQQCVSWTSYGYACSSGCNSGADCASGCCIALSNGTNACAPSSSYCGGGDTTCGSYVCNASEQCINWGSTSGSRCSEHCYYNSDCASGCCSALSDGTYACAPDTSFCGATGACGGVACSTSQRCLQWTGYGDLCTGYCNSSADCASGCCVTLSDGTNACAPNNSYCSSTTTCGGYACNSGERCVNWPSYGDLCTYGCYYNSDCASGCCTQLSDGSFACAPTYTGYCG